MHVMLDLETMGNSAQAPIIAIGAVEFDANGLGHTFYEVVDLESSMRLGLHPDASTIMWWMQQSDEARAAFKRPGVQLVEALTNFANWLAPNVELWGNGAAFDNAILSSSYRAANLMQPWKFWNDRCYRTVKAMYPQIKLERVGTYHNALDDAKSQAEHLIQIWKAAK